MRTTACTTIFCVTLAGPAAAQQIAFPRAAASDSVLLASVMPGVAREVLALYREDDLATRLNTVFRLQMLAGEHDSAIATIARLRELERATDSTYAPVHYSQYQILSTARLTQTAEGLSFPDALGRAYGAVYRPLDDRSAYWVDGSFRFYNLRAYRANLRQILDRVAGQDQDSLTLPDALELARRYFLYQSYRDFGPLTPGLMAAERARRYQVDTARVGTSYGAAVAAIVVRSRAMPGRQPAVLEFTIYAGNNNLETATESAANGYVGVVANTRGKRLDGAETWPYERDGADAADVVEWIGRQPWSNAKVGMVGGSYSGFTQWAAAKRIPSALKTIVPAVAVVPGWDTPMEHGVFQNYHFAWVPYVTNNRLLDDDTYGDQGRWAALDSLWYAMGAAHRALDSLDGTRYPVFQRWLDHPDYDQYWQRMIPQGEEYARIVLPVLTITGYFDGAQAGALHYLKEHRARNPGAEHYLLIGPWDHFGAQRRPSPVIAGHRIDPVAQLDITAIIYQWMDHVLKGGSRPALLADRVTYEVMGANEWRHAASLERVSNDTLTLYLSNQPAEGKFALLPRPSGDSSVVRVTANLADRTVATSNYIHDRSTDTTLSVSNGTAFVSAPLGEPRTVCGAFVGELRATINKRDMDIAVQLYALAPDGAHTQLSYFLGRASYLRDRTRRQLLRPGVIESLPFRDTRMVCSALPAGTRLVVVPNVNQSPHEQVNYGSGKAVADETIADAGPPLEVQWHGTSYVKIPMLR